MDILISTLLAATIILLIGALAMLRCVLGKLGDGGIRREIASQLRAGREEQAASFAALGTQSLEAMQASSRSVSEMADRVDRQLDAIRKENGEKLDRIRETVDEKLQKTLDARLAASFGAVSDQLQAVSRGLGEMQGLASDTRALKNALTNVKSRGTYGEVRCEKLLQDILAPSQYESNVNIQGNNVVEFAVKLPGNGGGTVYLPIDSKFPIEDYNRLLDAEDKDGIEAARKALRARVIGCAKDIRDKYILPPKTTDFAVMFLPTEGLYAEVIRDAALFEELRTKYSVTPVGVATLSAFLSSLQVGFRTLAIEQRAQDVQEALQAVKSELGKFGDLLAKAQKQVQQADATLGALSGTRLNAISRKLRSFDALPEQDAADILGLPRGE